MKPSHTVLLSRVLRYILFIIAATYIVMYVTIAAIRIKYPYELEWMEGASVDHVRQILIGHQLYRAPSIEFTPYIYTPLYFFVCSVFCKFLGIGFFPLRLVSLLSSVGCILLLFEFVRRETNSMFCGLLSASLYAAAYKIGGAWYDIARVDSLFMLLLLSSIFVLRFFKSTRHLVLAGILASLSFLTKQTALFIVLPLSVYCLIRLRKWNRYAYPSTFLIIAGFSTVIINWMSHGWYYYYIFDLPRQHEIIHSAVSFFWLNDLAYHLPVALGVSIFSFILRLSNKQNFDLSFNLLLALGMIGASWISRAHSGAYNNVLHPDYAVIALFLGLGFNIIVPEYSTHSDIGKETSRSASTISIKIKSMPFRILILLACIIQFAALYYHPGEQLPTQQDLKAGDSFTQILSEIEGEVFVPSTGYLPSLAGKKTYSHRMPIKDILRSKDREKIAAIRNEIVEAIHSNKFAAIILDKPWFIREIMENFDFQGDIFDGEDVFWPVTGYRTRPEMLYVLKKRQNTTTGEEVPNIRY